MEGDSGSGRCGLGVAAAPQHATTQKSTVFACDMAECIVEAERELTRWYEGVMREAATRVTSRWIDSTV
ncbi:MAG: hypothetical protein V8T86_00925 [Victivallis sp.]